MTRSVNTDKFPDVIIANVASSVQFSNVSCAVCFQFVDEADNGEDETSIAAHVAILKIQVNKTNPDMSVVSS